MAEIDKQAKAHDNDDERDDGTEKPLVRQGSILCYKVVLFLLYVVEGCQFYGSILSFPYDGGVEHLLDPHAHGNGRVGAVGPYVGREFWQQKGADVVKRHLHVIFYQHTFQHLELLGGLAPSAGCHEIVCGFNLALTGVGILSGQRGLVGFFRLVFATHAFQGASAVEVQSCPLLVDECFVSIWLLTIVL